MRPVRYSVAASLDGYIADQNGGFDWIPDDPTVDFAELFARVDTIIMGRRTYDVVRSQGTKVWSPGTRVYVFSHSLPSEPDTNAAGVTVIHEDPVAFTAALRHESGTGEIWLFGGGKLFATLLDGRQIDAVEVTIVPILLGGGIPLLMPGTQRAALALTHSHVYPSGMVALHYSVPGALAIDGQ